MKRKWLSALLSGALAAALTAAPVSAASVFTGETVDEWAVERVESAIRLELMPECLEGQDLRAEMTRAEFAALTVVLCKHLVHQGTHQRIVDGVPYIPDQQHRSQHNGVDLQNIRVVTGDDGAHQGEGHAAAQVTAGVADLVLHGQTARGLCLCHNILLFGCGLQFLCRLPQHIPAFVVLIIQCKNGNINCKNDNQYCKSSNFTVYYI